MSNVIDKVFRSQRSKQHIATDIENQLRNIVNSGLAGMHRLPSAPSTNEGVRK
jgi:hypothetical protein